MGPDATRVFHNGGTIGRAPGNDWVLPDPERFVSGEHAKIALEGGGYVLIDCSTNGTVLNGRELSRGARVQLGSGDVITIGSYEISVLMEREASAPYDPPAGQAPQLGSFPEPASVPGSDRSVDPLDFFADAGSAALPERSPASTPDHSPGHADYFAPPNVVPDPAIPDRSGPLRTEQSSAPAGGPGLIPENWDAAGPPNSESAAFSSPEAPPSSWAEDLFAPPPAPPAAEPSSAPPNTEFLGTAPVSPETAGHETPRPQPSRHGPPPARPRPADWSSPDATQASHRDPGHAPAGPTAGADPAGTRPADDLGALLHAAGIDPETVDAATLASLGEILRVVVDGLMEVLRARAEIKNQFRVAMTTLKPVENNPLKFSANAEDALFNLFCRRGQSFKAPVDAFREAFDDLKAHQVATMAGMRAAFTALMGRFEPERLQEGFDRGLKRGALLDVMNKTKYWDLYREMYQELGDDDATFRTSLRRRVRTSL